MRCGSVVLSGFAISLAAASVGVSVGCSSSSGGGPATPASDASVAPAACASGFSPLDDAGGCVPILAEGACGAGSASAIGQTACATVGVTACPPGFATAASGWGCDPVMPPLPCSGASRDSLGSDSCVPVGDCGAAFPPANATLFVSAAYLPAQIDATHFATVSAALAAATSGAVIAVETGTYAESLTPSVNVSVVGRCAEKVVFQAPDATKSGINLDSALTTSFSGFSMLGYHATIGMTAGDLTLDSVVVDGSHFAGIVVGNATTTAKLNNVVVRGTRASATDANSFGLFVGDGAKVTVTNSAFADNDYINVGVSGDGRSGASLDLSQSIVRNGHGFGAALGFGWGVYASDKVTLAIENSAIIANQGFGVLLNATNKSTAGTGKITGTVIRGTTIDPVNVSSGMGVEGNHSSVDVEQCTIDDSATVDVYAAAGTARVAGTVLGGTSSTDPTRLGPIGLITSGASITLDSAAIVGTRAGIELEGPTVAEIDDSLINGTKASDKGYYLVGDYVGVGLLVETAAQATLKNLRIQQTHTAGLIALGQVTATGLLIQGTRAGGDAVGGRAVSAQSAAVVSLQGSAFLDNIETGILAVGQSNLTLTDSTIDQTALDPTGLYGFGVLLDGEAIGTIATTTLRRGAGPALAVAGSGATVKSSVVVDNAIGVAVQGGSTIVEGDGNGDPLTVAISSDTLFLRNATRVGSGDIPIPPALTAPK